MPNDFDFIGFTYNGLHCINDFNVYRTSDGARYNDNLVPPMNDKTADIPGGDGQYYFYTKHKARQFSIPIAFDGLTEAKYQQMRTWLDGKGIHDLIFDEHPNKVYSAKVTGTPQLKTVCFDKDGSRIYKGEGTIQFTCYYPYAHSLSKSTSGKVEGDLPSSFVVTYSGTLSSGRTITIGPCSITLTNSTTNLQWDSKTGLVTGVVSGERVPVPYTGKAYGTVPVGDNISNPLGSSGRVEFYQWYY